MSAGELGDAVHRTQPAPSPILPRWALASFGGVLLSGAFPPWDVVPLVVLGPACLFASTLGVGWRGRAVLGGSFGLAFFGSLLFWVETFGVLPWLLLSLAEAGFIGAFAVAAGWLRWRDRPFLWALGTASLWVLVAEEARSRFPLGGFPWGPLAAPLVGTAFDAPGPVLGSLGVSWLAAVAAALLALVVWRRFGPAVRVAGMVGLTLAASALWPLPHPTGRALTVAVVQGDVPLPAGPATPERTGRVLANHVQLTRRIPAGRVDLVVWPEDVLDLPRPRPRKGERAPEPVATLARELGAWFLVGVTSESGPRRFLNSALAVSPEGLVTGVYDKTRPVPFGEYVPARSLLSFYRPLENVPRDMLPGRAVAPVRVRDVSVGVPISYEVAFGRIVREFARGGAELLAVLTNTSSYGPNAATAAQQLQLTRLRAVELGLWTVQASPSGISAVVDPAGRVLRTTGLFEPALVRATLEPRRGRTPFARHGEWPAVGLASALAAAAMVGRRGSGHGDASPRSGGYGASGPGGRGR